MDKYNSAKIMTLTGEASDLGVNKVNTTHFIVAIETSVCFLNFYSSHFQTRSALSLALVTAAQLP